MSTLKTSYPAAKIDARVYQRPITVLPEKPEINAHDSHRNKGEGTKERVKNEL